ncbi:MAG: aldo/keto reductase [Candidatus Solibacter usitatus]|nr:aldo/keto reductase [Candidatus Solibacter usitatus]
MERRTFVASALTLPAAAASAFPKRPYKDGIELSAIGFGGIVLMGMEQPEANRYLAQTWDKGINYYDVAPSYGNGEAEIKLGPALEPYRKNAFLACKTGKRDAAGAQEELERSLKRLRTDHFDLYQFHAVSSMDDVKKILAPGGAAEVFLKAKKEGKTRYVGFSAHNPEAALALLDAFPADSVLFPVNFACWQTGGFGQQILEKAKQKGAARLALKGMAYRPWPQSLPRQDRKYQKCWYEPLDNRAQAQLALRWTLSQEITAAVPPGEARLFEMALDIAAAFKPLNRTEQAELAALAKSTVPIFKA